MATFENVVALYKQARAIHRRDLDISKEDEAALDKARTAWMAARELANTASRARKDREQKEAEAEALVEAARAAYEAAEQPQKEAEKRRNIESMQVMTQVFVGVVSLVVADLPDLFGDVRSLGFVNSRATDEMRPGRYGEMEHVWVETLDAQPDPLDLRAIDAGDFRFSPRNGRIDELSFEVAALMDETYESGIRKDSFGARAEVIHDRGHFVEPEHVNLSWPGVGTRDITDRETLVKVYTIAIKLARLVERIIEEAK